MKTVFRRLGALVAATFVLSSAALAEEKISLNFVNADIESVVKAVSHATGRSFLLDPRVKGTVNLVSGKPVPESLALDILSSALRLQGFAMVESNGILKVLPEADAKTQAGISKAKGKGRSSVQTSAQLTTRVFQLRNESAAQLVPVLRPLIAPNNTITAYPGNNTLVITDYADNIARIEQVIEAIDVSPDGELEVFPLKHTSAFDVALTLKSLFSEGSVPTDANLRPVIIADSRSNSVLVRLDNPAKLGRIRNLINGLDQPGTTAGNIHVVRLKNADAVEMAQILRATMGSTNVGTGAAGAVADLQSSIGAQQPAQMGRNATGASAGSGGSFSMGAQRTSGLAAGSPVQADSATNSLIITAPDAIYNNLRTVIEQLDRRRAQVHIEALIVELTADKASEFGIQWQHLVGGTNTRLVGGTNFSTGGSNIVGVLENAAKATTTGSLGLNSGLNVGLLTGKYELSALMRALETDSQANILSTPSVVTLDNETAQIVIGQNVPFVTGSYAQTGTTVSSPFQTFERKDVGLSLKVRPMVTDGGVVRIQIYQEASSLQASSVSNSSGPITNKRSLESTVLVDDGNIIVLGGLINDQSGAGEDKVPLLGDIPGLGSLFRYSTRKRTKTNLMVFLRPNIIRDTAGYSAETTAKYNDIARQQQEYDKTQRGLLAPEATPQLPPLLLDNKVGAGGTAPAAVVK
jgi:general secretion pathway protein D